MAVGARAGASRLLLLGGRLSGQGLVEHLLGEDLANREQEVFDRVRKANPGPLADAELLHVYERIIDVMRTLQRRK